MINFSASSKESIYKQGAMVLNISILNVRKDFISKKENFGRRMHEGFYQAELELFLAL
jgi:hypothetical protein